MSAMMITGPKTPTAEQLRVIHHPVGRHAKVLAVAGSGKTETLARRIAILHAELKVPANRICVLMFNKLARTQFKERLTHLGMPAEFTGSVFTFHSFAFGLIGQMVKLGLLPAACVPWFGGREEEGRIHAHRVIRDLEKRGVIRPDSIDVDILMRAISKWKGSLIPPDRAGYEGNENVAIAYGEFEKSRIAKTAITFDDFVPLAVGVLETEAGLRGQFSHAYDHVIVDEYQDVNIGQQRLIELLASGGADVMVVGDDDQTIYEWRDARPDYIIDGFEKSLAGKVTDRYILSRSFRFGSLIAQTAQNTIRLNTRRVAKNLISQAPTLPSTVTVIFDHPGQAIDIDSALVDHIIECVKECGDPRNVAVLGRTYAQFLGIEAQLLARRIPYRVLGRNPFFDRHEIVALMNYAKVALDLDRVIDRKISDRILSIANKPSRMIRRDLLVAQLDRACNEELTVRWTLGFLIKNRFAFLPEFSHGKFAGLIDILIRIEGRLRDEPPLSAYEFFTWLIKALKYDQHFTNYYGRGLDSLDRQGAVTSFCESFAKTSGMNVPEFLEMIEHLDTTQGRPEAEQVLLTTAYKAKGLEFDHVIIPNANEGFMSCLKGVENPAYDLSDRTTTPPSSDILETERRLFYVAVTRARKSLMIGTGLPSEGRHRVTNQARSSRFIAEMMLPDTKDVMNLVTEIVRKSDGAQGRLVETIRKQGRIPSLWTDARDGYLTAALDEEELRGLNAEVEALPEKAHVRVETEDRLERDEEGPSADKLQAWWEREFA